jgi:hypothetical protein
MARTVLPERTAVAVEPAGRGYSLVRWGPSFAGAIAAIALTAMFMALWSALAYGSHSSYFAANLPWYFLGTALGALLVGGVIAGSATGLRLPGSSMLTGLTVWGLVMLAALVPLLLRGIVVAGHLATPGQGSAVRIPSSDIWTVFAGIGGGLLCAVFGSTLGGLRGRRTRITRREETRVEPRPGMAQTEPRPEMATPPQRAQRAG